MKRLCILAALALTMTLSFALGHETQTVGEGDSVYTVVVGYSVEPAFTEERNGLYLSIRTADGEPVENAQNSLSAVLVAPDGEELDLELRGLHGTPGRYTDDFALTEPGVYTLRLTGFIEGTEADLTFEMHEVHTFDELRFP